MTDVGSPFTQLQARVLGGFTRLHQFSSYPQENNEAEEQGVVKYTSANGFADYFSVGAVVETDGTDGAWGAIAVGTRAEAVGTGLVVLDIPWWVNEFGGDGRFEIGFVSRDPTDGTLNNRAVFRPDVGTNASGNVEVVSSGTTTQGQVDYSAVDASFINDNQVITSIIIDYDADETRFYFQDNPYFDPATETIEATPDKVTPMGIYIDDPDSNGLIATSFAEVTYVL